MNTDQRNFAQVIYQKALEVAKEHQINAEICTAQACLESAYGTSRLSKVCNNLFGIKAGKSWKGAIKVFETGEWEKGKRIVIRANFRAYKNIEECLKDYAGLVERLSYYKYARENCKDPYKYADGLKDWATDPEYSEKLVDLAKRLELI